MKNKNQLVGVIVVLAIIVGIPLLLFSGYKVVENFTHMDLFGSGTLKLLSSLDNKDLEEGITKYAREHGFKVEFTYMGDIEITQELNANPDKYDAVWVSNSLWLYMLNNSKLVSESKSISISPVVMGIRKSKAEQLGFVGKDVTNIEIVEKIRKKEIEYIMGTVTKTNDGASSYIGFLNALAGNPTVLTKEMLDDETLTQNLIDIFSGIKRSSGSDEYLEELFLNGSNKYDAIIASESTLIGLNKKLEAKGDNDLLYLIYPTDGVPINDSTLAFIDHYKGTKKKDNYLLLQQYLRSKEGQDKLESLGRRTWYGGINSDANKDYFKKDWGIDTEEYLTGTKFPSREVITLAINKYIEELRKPSHTVFCLDYSGSMYGEGIDDLREAMNYILDYEKAGKDQIQFSKKDKITVLPFSSYVLEVWNTDNGKETKQLINKINNKTPGGGTAIYDCSINGLRILKNESEDYLKTIILMTDGANNTGSLYSLSSEYSSLKEEIPIYSITFGAAKESELKDIARLTNAKVFDGKTNLLEAFKEVRGYF